MLVLKRMYVVVEGGIKVIVYVLVIAKVLYGFKAVFKVSGILRLKSRFRTKFRTKFITRFTNQFTN